MNVKILEIAYIPMLERVKEVGGFGGWGAKDKPGTNGNVGSAVKQHANNRLLKVINSLRGNEQ